MTVIYALSDMHGYLPDVPECDICIIAGDICPILNHDIGFQAAWLDSNFRTWLEKVPAKHIVGVAGNHDIIFEEQFSLVPKDLKWTYLHDQEVTIDGVKIYGTPYQRYFNGWPFMRYEEDLEILWSQMPVCDILVVHGPPYNAGDQTISEKAGSRVCARKLKELNIPWCICGHIHENYGIHQLENTQVANVAVCSNRYKLIHPPMFIPFKRFINAYS